MDAKMLIACAAVIAVVAASGCVRQSVPDGDNGTVANACSDEARMETARQFVLASSTYAYDGSNLQLVEAVQAKCTPYCWRYTFTFNSSQPGYANRTADQNLPEMILVEPTRIITAVVIVSCGDDGNPVVTQATLDDKWDMLADEAIDTETQIANPASVYCEEQGGELVIDSTPDGEIGYCTTADGDVCEEWEYFRSDGLDCTAPAD